MNTCVAFLCLGTQARQALQARLEPPAVHRARKRAQQCPDSSAATRLDCPVSSRLGRQLDGQRCRRFDRALGSASQEHTTTSGGGANDRTISSCSTRRIGTSNGDGGGGDGGGANRDGDGANEGGGSSLARGNAGKGHRCLHVAICEAARNGTLKSLIMRKR